jgi:hypothetical protein
MAIFPDSCLRSYRFHSVGGARSLDGNLCETFELARDGKEKN